MKRHLVWMLAIAMAVGLAEGPAGAQGIFGTRPFESPELPGSGGTLPDAFVGTYTSPRAQSPSHEITVTPYGLSSTMCHPADCQDGSLLFDRVDCPVDASCVFVGRECTGSLTRGEDGALLLTASATDAGRQEGYIGLCRSFAGTAPLRSSPRPIADGAARPPTGDPCESALARLRGSERVAVPVPDGRHVRGPLDAPVTIVEFSDFQCPFCSRVQTTLDTVMARYDGQVRLVFRHHPLPFHSDAPLAHEASLAAAEQGLFWEMHDRIFENQRALTRPSLDAHARSLGLDMLSFGRFVDEWRGEAVISQDTALAASVGATGTPNFFINGRQLTGAQPIDAFSNLIDEELRLAASLEADTGLAPGDLYECIQRSVP